MMIFEVHLKMLMRFLNTCFKVNVRLLTTLIFLVLCFLLLGIPSAYAESVADDPLLPQRPSAPQSSPQSITSPAVPLPSSSSQAIASPPTQPVVLPQEPLQQGTPLSLSSGSANQFQQWLERNGYAQNPTANKTGTVSTTTTTTRTSSRRLRSVPKPLTYEQGQEAMLRSVPKSPVPQSEDAGIAFNGMLQQNMPLSPQQVVRLHQQIDLAQRAAAVPANIPPKPVSTTLMINLAPGTTPPAVRLAQGYVSSLVFVDSTGSPWPIAAYDIGNPKAVNIQWDGKSNILLLQAVSPYSNGDIVIRLVGLPTPITLEIVSGQRVVDYRIDLHVSGIGPNTKELPLGTTLPNSANQLLLGVLDGIAPAGSKPLAVHGADSQAWLMGEKMYLRTRLTVLSPGWVGTMVSPDGMHAYELPKTSSVLVSRYGEPVELKIEGF